MSVIPLLILAAVLTLAYYGFKDMFLVLNRHYNNQQPLHLKTRNISLQTPSHLASSFIVAE